MDSPRKLAEGILEKVLEGDGKSHLLLQECFAAHPALSARDRRFITGLVHGTVEYALFLDGKLRLISSVPPEKMKPAVRTVLRMGLYQLLFLDRVPASAAVNESVRLIKARNMGALSGFVNAVLRAAAARTSWPACGRAEALSLPAWLYTELEERFGAEKVEEIGQAFLAPSVLSLRINRSREGSSFAEALMEKDGWSVSCTECAPPGGAAYSFLLASPKEEALPLEECAAFREGLVQPQDSGTMKAVSAADPRPGMKVLDLCAAPGGKSLQAADSMNNQGEILSCDLTAGKIKKIEDNRDRCGFSCIRACAADAAVFDPGREEAFDLVIADLPCSGLGVIGRKPEIKYRVTPQKIRELAALQAQILEGAVRYVKPGGKLLYSTCTLTAEENEENAARIAQAKGFRLLKEETLLPEKGRDGFYYSLFVREDKEA